MSDRFPDLEVRIQRPIAEEIIDQPGRQRAAELATPRRVEDAAAQPRSDDMQLSFADSALQTQQKPVVEAGRVVNAIFVEDQGVGKVFALAKAITNSAASTVAKKRCDLEKRTPPRGALRLECRF